MLIRSPQPSTPSAVSVNSPAVTPTGPPCSTRSCPERPPVRLPREGLSETGCCWHSQKLQRPRRGISGGAAGSRNHLDAYSVEAIEGPQHLDRCVVGMEACNDQKPVREHHLYKPIRQRLKDYFNTTSLADLVASLRSKQTWLRTQTAQSAAATAARSGESSGRLKLRRSIPKSLMRDATSSRSAVDAAATSRAAGAGRGRA